MYKQNEGQSSAWELVELLGEGSFGQVYKARRQLLGKTNYSAIKVIKIPQNESQINSERISGASDQEIRDYFYSIVKEWQSEIELLESLKSAPNVMVVEDYEIIEHPEKIQWEIYIRMELLTPFTQRLQSSSFTSSEAIKLGIDLCRALEYCNVRNIIHRDIKPENIFISSFGDYKLGDFGIARQLEKTNSSLSKKGTYMYMAPEVYRGEQYDASVDIYSLGLVLYKLFNNNRFPFAPQNKSILSFGEREECLGRRVRGDALPLPVNASDDIANVILKACAYDPINRYKTPSEFMKALQILQLSQKTDIPLMSVVKVESDMTESMLNERKTNTVNDSLSSSHDLTTGLFKSMSRTDGTSSHKDENLESKSKLEKTSPQDEHNTTFASANTETLPIKTKKTNKGLSLIAALSILFLVGALFITQGFGFFSPTREVEIPNVVLIHHEDATNQLKKIGIKVTIVEVIDESQPEGTVLEQSIDPQNMVIKGSTIQLKVAKAIEKVNVPLVVGMENSTAITMLEDLGLIVTIKDVIDDNKPLGEVIAQSISANTSINIGSTIELSTVIHTAKVAVPNLIGKTEEQAKEMLTNEGLKYKITYVIDDSKIEGQVFNQSEAANNQINVGSTVEVSIYKKSNLIIVPSYSGLSVANYKSEAEKLGFKVVTKEVFSDNVVSGAIASVSPKVGSKVDKGSTITVNVSKGKNIEMVKVPAGVGSTYTTFETNAKNVGLILNKTDKCSNTVASGQIITLNPSEGTSVSKGSSVNVTVSIGACPWSEWVGTLPSNVSTSTHDVETKTQYQFRDKETTTSPNATLSGWTQYEQNLTGYGSWSNWQTSSLSESTAINVETRTVYVFQRYKWNQPQGSIGVSYSYMKFASFSTPNYYQEIRVPSLSLAVYRLVDEYAWHYFKISANSDLLINQWYGTTTSPYIGGFDKNLVYTSTNAGSTEWYSKSKTGRAETEYRSRPKIYSYSYYRWTAWSAWQDAAVTANANKEVQTRVIYRYRSK